MNEIDDAMREAAAALQECMSGDDASGLSRYAACMRPRLREVLPLGLHAAMLEGAGRHSAASALRALVLARGGDLAWRPGLKWGSSPEVRIAEYERWFASGTANPAMVANYIRELGLAARDKEVTETFDTERLLRTTTLGDPGAVCEALLAAERTLTFGSRQVTQDMRYLLNLEALGDPVFDSLLAALRAEIEAYVAAWSASDHPLSHLVPCSFTLTAWAMIARAEGRNLRHQHSMGWVTGVYYPAGLPDESIGGTLNIGAWSEPAPAGWPAVSIRPEPGLLVLMPSWYVHWTEPTGVPGARLAIAFDAVPPQKEAIAAPPPR